jgi:V8-like Glu-specific endopeptidase
MDPVKSRLGIALCVAALLLPSHLVLAQTADSERVLATQVQEKKQAWRGIVSELIKGMPNSKTLKVVPLAGSNGDAPKTMLRTSDIPPVALSKTLQRLTDKERVAIYDNISSEIGALTEQLQERLAIENKSKEVNDEIAALNSSLSAKQQAREFTLGNVTNVSNAAAESFAAVGNPYFLMCGDVLWARADPLKWLDQLAPRKDVFIRAGRSVGLLTLAERPAGTAFVVGTNHIVTNLHVVKLIADLDPVKKIWKMKPNVKVTFDVEYPLGADAACPSANPPRSYYVNGVFAVPPKEAEDDIAILITSSDNNFPAALAVKKRPEASYSGNLMVAVIGYPGPPADMTAAEQIQFFSTPVTLSPQFPYKRLSEGFTGDQKVTSDGFFVHKANTAGGNSGSPIFDLSNGEVVGIHVEGNNRFNDVMGYNRGLIGDRILKLLARGGL